MDLTELLALTINRGASDLHLVAEYPPSLRINGELKPLVSMNILNSQDIENMIFSCLSAAQKELLIANRELDFSAVFKLNSEEKHRFRVNSYFQKNTLAASFRVIPTKIKSLAELNLPQILANFATLRDGLVLLTGPSGQGKSTTIASIIQIINENRQAHIISIEDPIEYEFTRAKAMVSQREMYQDTHSWLNALKYAVREDPDVVFIGEMRDYETISSALTIAETGHLVFSTLHTNSASQTIDRIIDIFPSGQQAQVRMQLSMVVRGIVSQRLVPMVAGGRLPICEVLLGTDSVKNTIREGNTHMIDNIIQTSGESGMMLFEEHLRQKVDQNLIAHEVAVQYALRPATYLQLIR